MLDAFIPPSKRGDESGYEPAALLELQNWNSSLQEVVPSHSHKSETLQAL